VARGAGLISQGFLGARLVLLIDPGHAKAAFRDTSCGDIKTTRQLTPVCRNRAGFFRAVEAEFNYAWPARHNGKYSSYLLPFHPLQIDGDERLLSLLGDIYRLVLLDFAHGQRKRRSPTRIS